MSKNIMLLVLSCLLSISLLVSCSPAPAEEEKVTEQEGEVTVTPDTGEPQYGGTITVRMTSDPRDFDEAFANSWGCWTLGLTNDPLVTVDWEVGPSGTGEADIMKDCYYPSFSEYIKPHLCESFEFPDPGTHIYHIRKGIHFQNKPPANGREMTAEDVMYSVKRLYEMPGSWVYQAHAPISYETPDKYTLILKFDGYNTYDIMRAASITYTVPREVVELENGEGLRNWENACGTGPYMLTRLCNW